MSNRGLVVTVSLLSAALGSAIIIVAGRINGSDPAQHLSEQLGLPNGVVLGALLGGVVGLWLAVGGRPRAARWAGWIAALLLGALIGCIGRQVVWIIDVVLIAVFGSGAEGLGPFIGIGILLAIVRGLGRSLSATADGLLAGQTAGLITTDSTPG